MRCRMCGKEIEVPSYDDVKLFGRSVYIFFCPFCEYPAGAIAHREVKKTEQELSEEHPASK